MIVFGYYILKDLTIEQKLENMAQGAQWLTCTVRKVSQGAVGTGGGEGW